MDTEEKIVDPFCCSVPDSYFDPGHLVYQPLLGCARVGCTTLCHVRYIAERDPYFVVVVATCSYSVCHLVVVDDSEFAAPGDFGESVDH